MEATEKFVSIVKRYCQQMLLLQGRGTPRPCGAISLFALKELRTSGDFSRLARLHKPLAEIGAAALIVEAQDKNVIELALERFAVSFVII